MFSTKTTFGVISVGELALDQVPPCLAGSGARSEFRGHAALGCWSKEGFALARRVRCAPAIARVRAGATNHQPRYRSLLSADPFVVAPHLLPCLGFGLQGGVH